MKSFERIYSKGFTLIELVVVILILGIVAVTAAPRFMGVSREAKIAILDSFAGAFTAADGIVMGKAMVAGVDASIPLTNIPNTDLYVLDGHMSHMPEHIKSAMDLDGIQLLDTALSVFAYLGNEPLSRIEIVEQGCFLYITRRATQESGKEWRYEDFQFHRHYDKC